MSTLQVDIVSIEGHLFSGEASLVVADASEGQVGIAPRHAPFLARLVPGEVRVVAAGGTERVFYVSGGFLEVQPHHVTVLADVAERGEDLDEAAAEAARRHAEDSLQGASGKEDLARAERELIESAARYRVLRRFRGKRRTADTGAAD